jgi:hypothetical protein
MYNHHDPEVEVTVSIMEMENKPEPSSFGGLEVSVLAFGTQVRGFKPGRSRRIFKGKKFLSTPSFRGEVKPSVPCRRFAACKRSLNAVWKSKLQAILAHKFHLSLLGSRVVWMWRHLAAEAGTSNIGGGGGVQGCTISLQAAVHLRHTPRALIEKKKKKPGPGISSTHAAELLDYHVQDAQTKHFVTKR